MEQMTIRRERDNKINQTSEEESHLYIPKPVVATTARNITVKTEKKDRGMIHSWEK